MSFSGGVSGHAMALLAHPLLFLVVIYACFWPRYDSSGGRERRRARGSTGMVSMRNNRTLIIAVVNKAYVEEKGMLNLFLRSFREGEGTAQLVEHLRFVEADQASYGRCLPLWLNCYKLVTEGVDFFKEAFYMFKEFIGMMWRTLFLGDVLRRSYSFIFTDMDVLWLCNPLLGLNHHEDDLLISSDLYNGNPYDHTNYFNTGYYVVTQNNRTVALFDEWLELKVRYLDTTYFTGFCQKSKDFGKVITVHSNCCVSVKAKLIDLTAVLHAWKMNNGTSNSAWPTNTGFCLREVDALH